ncbi:MAG: hypothetical protein OEN56_09650 [Gemmatimonadota bacterium]|nr:hypothetical protein [Gemmatimonadota bacterium]
MIRSPRRLLRLGLVCAAGAGPAACATGLPDVQPADIPRLEQEVSAQPGDTDLQVQLGVAQFRALDYDAARQTLQAAIEAGTESGAALLHLGMANEELEDWSGARRAYNQYLSVGVSATGRAEVRKRLTMIGRNLLRTQAQQALAQEQEITAMGQITPQSVAILPLGFNSEREDLEPLIYALSDVMITDFKVSKALVVLERAQIQALLDEMALTPAGYADSETGARAGRLLRAEHVFQGFLTTLGDNDLQTDADVLDVPSTSSAGQIRESAGLERLFDMEKQLVIRTIREVLGVELTPAEERTILENRMSNVLALLAYGRGLRQLDLGNYAAAQAEFEAMMSLEPGGFDGAEVAMGEAAALVDASGTSTVDLAGVAGATGEWGRGFFAPPPASTTEDLASLGIRLQAPLGAGATDGQATTDNSASNTLRNVSEGVDPTPTATTLDLGSAGQSANPTPNQSQPTSRDPTQESSGLETIPGTAEALIRIIIRRPGGAQ